MSPSSSPPTCGGKAVVSSSLSLWGAIGLVMGIVFGGMGVAGLLHLVGLAKLGQSLINLISGAASANGFSLDAVMAIILAAVIAAVSISVWLWSNYTSLSSDPPLGTTGCIAGVINEVQGANIGIFTLAHGLIQVVATQCGWPTITQGSPPFVWCSTCDNCPQSDWPAGTIASDAKIVGCSPMLPCVYRSQMVVNQALGEAIGGTIGAGVGAVLGILAGIAALGALGCAATAVLSLFCFAALILAILVALLVVAAIALYGLALGGGIADGVSPNDTSPTGTGSGGGTVILSPGAYVMVVGNLTQNGNLNGSNAIYFAGWIPDAQTGTVVDQTQSNGSGTTVFGNSMGAPPFCFTDPNAQFPVDPCTSQSSSPCTNPSS